VEVLISPLSRCCLHAHVAHLTTCTALARIRFCLVFLHCYMLACVACVYLK